MTDLKKQYQSIKAEIDAAIQEVLDSAAFIQGKQVGLFEEEICRHFGCRFAVGVASGTEALVLALAALGIGPDDEVITTPFTFIATAEAINRVGARPVFCDIDPVTYNIDVNKIGSKITKRTKGILPVHLYGLPCPMDRILSIAEKHNLRIIEDCAQSFGAEYGNKKVGTFGDCGTLSFFPAKNLGCFGDGGMVITNDEETAKKLGMLRTHGASGKYIYSLNGFNSRLDTLQAAILRVKLRHIDNWITQRIDNADYYNQLLAEVPQVKIPSWGDRVKHSFNYYTLRIQGDRQHLQDTLKDQGVPTAVFYPLSLHLQEVYKEMGHKAGDFPVSEEAQDQVLSLPMYPELSKEDIGKIVEVIKSFYNACLPQSHQ